MKRFLQQSLWTVWRVTRSQPRLRSAIMTAGKRLGLSQWAISTMASNPPADAFDDDDLSSTYGELRPYVSPPPEHLAAIESVYLEQRRRAGNPAPIAVVTAIMGRYETPIRHEHLLEDADYVLVSDSPVSATGAATLVRPDYFDSDPVRAARFVKTHPNLYAPHADLIVWIDGNIVIRGDLRPLITTFLASGKAVGAIPHPSRQTLEEEARACLARSKDDRSVILEQLSRYRALGFSTEQLAETNLLMLRMEHPETRRFLAAWWEEIERGSRRDQLSFNFAMKKAGIDYFPLMAPPDSVRNHPQLALISHRANQRDLPPPPESAVDVKRVPPRPTPLSHPVDIAICVHNALEVTRQCLASVAAHRDSERHCIVIVDDDSDTPTHQFLADFAQSTPNCSLVRHDIAVGYTKAANAGLRATASPFVILLNSDTIVAPGFADKLATTLSSTPGAGIVGPMSNAASGQSLPNVEGTGGQTAINTLPPGWTVDDMDRWCAGNGAFPYPRVPLVHGFCFGLTRDTIDRVGLFDEINFPQGFGEENDYCMRATNAGIGLVIATDTYVFHAKTQSYDPKRRISLSTVSNARVRQLHGELRMRRSILAVKLNPQLIAMREAARHLDGQPPPPTL